MFDLTQGNPGPVNVCSECSEEYVYFSRIPYQCKANPTQEYRYALKHGQFDSIEPENVLECFEDNQKASCHLWTGVSNRIWTDQA